MTENKIEVNPSLTLESVLRDFLDVMRECAPADFEAGGPAYQRLVQVQQAALSALRVKQTHDYQATHSAGPWICYADTPSVDPNWHIITTLNKQKVIANVHIEPGNQKDLANAALLTQAPELLKACMMTIDENKHLADGDNCTLRHIVKAVDSLAGPGSFVI